jgi:hypothetical protein
MESLCRGLIRGLVVAREDSRCTRTRLYDQERYDQTDSLSLAYSYPPTPIRGREGGEDVRCKVHYCRFDLKLRRCGLFIPGLGNLWSHMHVAGPLHLKRVCQRSRDIYTKESDEVCSFLLGVLGYQGRYPLPEPSCE